MCHIVVIKFNIGCFKQSKAIYYIKLDLYLNTIKNIIFYFIVEQIPYANAFLWFLGKHSSLGRNCGIILSTGYNILQARKKQAQKVCFCSFLSKLVGIFIITLKVSNVRQFNTCILRQFWCDQFVFNFSN